MFIIARLTNSCNVLNVAINCPLSENDVKDIVDTLQKMSATGCRYPFFETDIFDEDIQLFHEDWAIQFDHAMIVEPGMIFRHMESITTKPDEYDLNLKITESGLMFISMHAGMVLYTAQPINFQEVWKSESV